MISLASGLRVYLACGVTEMRKGMTGSACASATSGDRIALSALQFAALLDGCEWRAPVPVRRPELAG